MKLRLVVRLHSNGKIKRGEKIDKWLFQVCFLASLGDQDRKYGQNVKTNKKRAQHGS